MAFTVALDYDGTLFVNAFPLKGQPNQSVIDKAKELKKYGAELVLWTCREGNYLEDAVEHAKDHGLEFDAVNENSPSQKAYIQAIINRGDTPFGLRKINADIFIDDKAPGSIDYFLGIDAEKTCRNFS